MNDDQLNVNTVAGSGYLDGYACWSSYGRSSPRIEGDGYGVHYGEKSGNIGYNWNVYVDTVSYGRSPYRVDRFGDALGIYRVGYDGIVYNAHVYENSYGIIYIINKKFQLSLSEP